MLIKDRRPKSFNEMWGAEFPIKVLKKIAKEPQTAPHSLILAGPRGLGKTSASRIFAKAVNCKSRRGDACNVCDSCLSIIEGSSLYQEFDSSIIGNVEGMKALRDIFGYSAQEGYRVLSFDEVHLFSNQAMSSLLKVLEEGPKKTFFVFSTTNIEKVLDTIKSRSLVLGFQILSEACIIEILRNVAKEEKIFLSEEVIKIAARRSSGHIRDALQQLETVKLVGMESYLKSTCSLTTEFLKIYSLQKQGKFIEAERLIRVILTQPSIYIKQDFDLFIEKLTRKYFIEKSIKDSGIQRLIFHYLKYSSSLSTSNDWYIFLCSLCLFCENKKSSGITDESRYRR